MKEMKEKLMKEMKEKLMKEMKKWVEWNQQKNQVWKLKEKSKSKNEINQFPLQLSL